MRLRKFFGLSLVVALLAGTALAIGAGSTSAQDQPSFPVQIKFLNAMTAQKQIDVYINGSDKDQRVIEGLEYGTVSEPFDGTSPATGIVVKQNVNLGFDQWLFNTAIPTEAGKTYLVVISDFTIIPVQEDTSQATADAASVRLVHAASQAPGLDVVIDDKVVTTDIKYGRATDVGLIAGGTYDVKLNATGTDTTILESTDGTVENGNAYTFVIMGEPGSTEEPLMVVVDVTATAPSAEATPSS